ncbi:MAG: glucose-6-phosphate dehydrogenase [Bacillota bacterium]
MENGSLIIFGGSGNLSLLKIYPALFNLYINNNLPNKFNVISVAKTNRDVNEFKKTVKEYISKQVNNYSESKWEKFERNLYYFSLDFKNIHDYKKLKNFLNKLQTKNDNYMFYLATSPNFFKIITKNLYDNNMINKDFDIQRIIFEKPFGYDYDSAKILNDYLTKYINEDDIFRIDHYLGKDMIQNIMFLRFSNTIFENIWNKENIDNIQITSSEKMGIGKRGNYFEKSGTIRDMVQNHLLQILAITIMDLPESFKAKDIIDKKVKIFKNLEKFNDDDFDKKIILGQYSKNENLNLKGYREENSIPDDSFTETFVLLKTYVNTIRWKGVPFYLKTGKRLSKKELYITIEFKNKEKLSSITNMDYNPNVLKIKITPEEGIELMFNIKTPVEDNSIMPVKMDFCKSCVTHLKSPKAYEKIIKGIFSGKSTLFTRWDEVKYTWKYIDSITKCCDQKKSQIIEFYKAGTNGPEKARKLLKKDNRKWWKY